MNRRAEWGDEHARRSAEVCLEDTLDDMQFEGRFGNFTFTPTKNGTIEFKQKRVSSQKFEEQTLRRFEQYEQRRKEKLLVQKKEHMKLELTPFTMEPSINDQKRKEPKRNPLISRLDEILESRKIKIEGKKNSFVSKAEKEAKECTFHPNINSR
jgi:hypothetical protein